MSCCLKEQSKRHLDTVTWRNLLMIKRNTQVKIFAIAYPILLLVAAIVMFASILKGTEESLHSMQSNVVTSSTFSSEGKNIFVDDASGLETTQDFKQCFLNNAKSIGLVKPGDPEDPSNLALDDIYDQINTAFKLVYPAGMQKKKFDNYDKVNEFVQQSNYEQQKLCFVLGWDKFQLGDGDTPEFTLEIMTDYEQSGMQNPDTPQERLYDIFYSNKTLTAYNDTDILQVMATTTKVLIDKVSIDARDDNFSILYTPMNTPQYKTLFQDTTSSFIAVVFELVMFSVAVLLGAGAEPREDMIQLIMKRLGVQKSVLVTRDLLTTFIYGMGVSLIYCLAFWGVLFKDCLGLGIIILFVTVAQTQSILRQTIFSHVLPRNLGSLIAAVLLVLQVALSYVFVSGIPVVSQTVVGCIISPMLQLQFMFHFGYVAISFGEKVDFNTFSENMFPGVSLALIFGIAMIMLCFYGAFLLYIWPLVIESDPENPLNWYYPVQCSFWRNQVEPELQHNRAIDTQDSNSPNQSLMDNKDTSPDHEQSQEELGRMDLQENLRNIDLQEAEVELVRKGMLEIPAQSQNNPNAGKLVVSNLTKRYGDKNVVNDLSLTMYQNEILVLLGHNGAGKTTTLNILTGLIQPSTGSAIASNIVNQPVDLFTDYQNIADFIGLCPQVDVLFTKMTVKENLIFYCKLKNVENMDTVVDETLQKFNLAAKANNWAGEISGGQKRKLQLAIALVGNARIVLLDEPTSGMDPTARRETWELIKQAKQDKIIILTTHYMDEAEYLADRVAVVSKGQLQVCGTTSFLKQKFGQYFYLEVDRQDANGALNKDLMALLNSSNDKYRDGRSSFANAQDQSPSNSKKVLQIVEENKRDSISSQANHEYEDITFHIDEAGKGVYKLGNYLAGDFAEIFEQIDSNLEGFGIKSYSIRNMTLEQVFIAIGDQEIKTEMRQEEDLSEAQQAAHLIDDLPQLQQASFTRNVKSLLISTSQQLWNDRVFSRLIVLFIFMLVLSVLVYVPLKLRTYSEINYGDVDVIYTKETGSKVTYNPTYSDGSENKIAAQILSSQTVFTGSPSDKFNPPQTIGNYTDYLEQLSDDIAVDSGEYGAYWIDASKSALGKWDINAVVYMNASSPASAPVFGNLLLQSIAQTVTGKSDFKLDFKYQCFEQTVGMLVQKDAGFALPIPTVANILTFYLEVWLTLTFLEQVSGGFYRSAVMRGATKASFILPRLVVNFAIWFIYFEALWLSNIVMGIDTTGWQILGLLFCLAQSLYFACFDALVSTNMGWVRLKYVFLAVQIFLISFSSSITGVLAYKAGTTALSVISCLMMFSPTVQLLFGIMMIFYRNPQYVLQNYIQIVEEGFVGDVKDVEPFGEYGAQLQMLILIGQICVYSLLILLVLGLCKGGSAESRKEPVEPERDDFQTPAEVTQESQRVENMINGDLEQTSDIIIVHNLVKRYYSKPPADQDNGNVEARPSTVEEDEGNVDGQSGQNANAASAAVGFNAVKGTSFGVKRGEVFSLLGVNGAGKSSTFNCLVGYTPVSGGSIILDQRNVNTFIGNVENLHGLIGYCPQTNTFEGKLTVHQTLTLFGSLVGIPDNSLTAYVNSTVRRFGLSNFTDTLAGNLSGGNMRKLSLAMAMIGRPKIILIDEASTGVDPTSRRTMWQAIRHEGQQSAVIMTTHAMEEAEAISTKIAIQVSGFFRSFGTLAQVQREGKSGYYVDINFDLDVLMQNFSLSHNERLVRDRQSILSKLQIWEEEMKSMLGQDKQLNYADELKAFGILDGFHRKLEKGQVVDLGNMLHQLLIQESMAGVINSIERAGMKSIIKNYDGAYVSIEINNCNMSFGKIYAFMESIRARNSIKDFSCKLSSLEEVFNAHANEAMFMNLNKRIERRRTSLTFQSVQE